MCNHTNHGSTLGNVLVQLSRLSLFAVLICGCGSESSTSGDPADAASQSDSRSSAQVPPVAAINGDRKPGSESPGARIAAEPGSPEALLMRIAALIAETNADVERTQALEADGKGADAEATANAFRRRLEQVVDLATQVISLTHLDPAAEQSFNNAVHYLSDARLELASAGDTSQAGLLIEDANSLYERDKTSFAAAEAGSKVVELAERMARSLGSEDSEWLVEYATQARQFAERFPHEPSRSAMGLFNAGRLCDRFELADQARQCLQQVQTQFPETIFAEQSAGILRRLSLLGQPLELAGPTIDGGFAEIDHYQGRPVLVVFWATTSPTFQEQLPILKQVEAQSAAAGLVIIGINLDTDEAAVDRFLAAEKLAWPQVFSADPAQRGGRNPVARYYGVQILPTYWLVDGKGIVVNDRVSVGDLPAEVAKVLAGR